ncbi:MAG: hypothetical protein J6V44_10020 [Methanobrevibacter sp.]|nr:hypothetical protein [Methanobrevibacter sp.]MBO7695172.1 hypothetical protein [Methanobrevibacter sp.]
MITKNFENYLASILSFANNISNASCGLQVFTTYGMPRFVYQYQYIPAGSGVLWFPGKVNAEPSFSNGNGGIVIGKGTTPPTKDDIALEDIITSGVTVTVTLVDSKTVTPGYPQIEFNLTVTNTSNEEITISEIGYQQLIYVGSGPTAVYSSSPPAAICLFDRTVFETPITIQSGDAGVIEYTLCVTTPQRTKNGVNLVSFTYGSDEDVAAMIDAARIGLIDLQEDGLWKVGDSRRVELSQFTGGGSVDHQAQSRVITITQFGDYNNCGCLFQFDFTCTIREGQRINATRTNVGGYSSAEIYTTTLPALVDALPIWLKDRLKTFDVLVSAGAGSSEIVTVSNNKLALRSAVEVLGEAGVSSGTNNYTYPGEGTQVDFYKNVAGSHRITYVYGVCDDFSDSNRYTFTRSPYYNVSSAFAAISWSSAGIRSSSSTNITDSTYGYISSFGCI